MTRPVDMIHDAWYEAMVLHPNWRSGQALFNVLRDYDPAVAEVLRVSDSNPFYDNGNIKAAWNFIHEAYNH